MFFMIFCQEIVSSGRRVIWYRRPDNAFVCYRYLESLWCPKEDADERMWDAKGV